MRRFACAVIPVLLLAGACQSQRVSNSARYISYWQPDDARKGYYHYKCLEPVGPSARSTDAELSAESVEVPVSLSVGRNEDVTVAYAVTDEAQRLSTILYRLCEARGNEAISQQEYHDLVMYTVQRTGQVMPNEPKETEEAADSEESESEAAE